MNNISNILYGKRILFYSSYPGFSGSQKMALQIAISFDKLGAKVVAVAPDEMEYLDRAHQAGLKTFSLKAPLPILRYGGIITNNIFNILKAAFAVILYYLRVFHFLHTNQIDLIYAATGRCMLLIGPAAFFAHKPIIWHVQGGLIGGSRLLYRFMSAFATRMVCVSHSVMNDVQCICGDKIRNKLTLIYNGLPDIPSYNMKPLFCEKIIGFIGNVVPQKGIHHLVKAYALLPQEFLNSTQLWIVGNELDKSYSSHLRNLANRLGISERVKFLGYRKDISYILKKMMLVVAPSVERENLVLINGDVRRIEWKEGFCLSVLEAMRAAKPVIASNTYGLAEVVSDGESGILVRPGDDDALNKAFLMFLSEPDRIGAMGKEGRRRFLSQFNREDMITAFQNIASQLLTMNDR